MSLKMGRLRCTPSWWGERSGRGKWRSAALDGVRIFSRGIQVVGKPRRRGPQHPRPLHAASTTPFVVAAVSSLPLPASRTTGTPIMHVGSPHFEFLSYPVAHLTGEVASTRILIGEAVQWVLVHPLCFSRFIRSGERVPWPTGHRRAVFGPARNGTSPP